MSEGEHEIQTTKDYYRLCNQIKYLPTIETYKIPTDAEIDAVAKLAKYFAHEKSKIHPQLIKKGDSS